MWEWIKSHKLGVVFCVATLAILVLVFAGYVRVSQRAQFDETLERGLELMAHNQVFMRTAGVRLLEELHKNDDTPKRQEMIRKTLRDFVRQHFWFPPRPPMEARNDIEKEWLKPRPDVEIIIRILANHTPDDERRTSIDLSNLYLRSLNLSSMRLSYADLSGADLVHADLSRADLTYANLAYADLTYADLKNAKLSGAAVYSADLTNVNLRDADLSGADLAGTKLREARLSDANLSGTFFTGADLTGARLRRADLTSANLIDANLSGANLKRANLSGAYLDDVHNLTQSQLDTAIYLEGQPPKDLPTGLTISKKRAYELAEDEKGKLRRRFVHSKEWIDD